jgi:xylulokinase
LRNELSPGSSYDELVALIDPTLPCADGLLFLPTFNGSSAPHPDPDARGCLLGLRLTHTFGHIVRAVLEGISLELRWMLDAMVETASTEVDEVRLVGGGARNSRWNRIHADVLGRPLSLLQVPDAGMVGAAMCAAVAVGAYADFQAAAEAFVRIEGTIEPDSAHDDDYSALSDRYRSTFDRLTAGATFAVLPHAPEHV